jgi:hypothetical protein
VLRRVGDALDLVASSNAAPMLRCRACGALLGPSLADGTAARVRCVPLAAAGPWLARRWAGHSPNFVLREVICPGCGRLLDVQERRRPPGEEETTGCASGCG